MPFQVGGVSLHNDTQHTGSAKRSLASGVAGLDAASLVIQDPASKGLASGVAGLDAAVELPLTNLKAHSSAKHDTTVPAWGAEILYTGNGSQNRTVAHNSADPKLILLKNKTSGSLFIWSKGRAASMNLEAATSPRETFGILSVDGTNITIGSNATGDNANLNANDYVMRVFT